MADALQGTWVFNDSLSPLQTGDFDTYFNFSFYDNGGNSYTSLTTVGHPDSLRVNYSGLSGNSSVYFNSWLSSQYRTITITTAISDLTGSTYDFNEDVYIPLSSAGTLFLSWLQANATKQAAPSPAYPKINSFTYHGKQINNINGKHIRYVHDKRAGVDNTYEMVYVVQLTTPQNVTAVGTTVSWDVVENATSYAVLADGNEIGTVEGTVTPKFVQIFPTTTPDNYTLIENINQSKIYSIQSDITQPDNIVYLNYENAKWKLWVYEYVNGVPTGKTVDLSYLIYSQTGNSVKFMAVDGSYFGFYTSGITIEGDSEATKADFAGFSPTEVYAYWVCFVEGTKITLSDGSTKLVQDIQYGDKVLCYDFTNGVQTISYIDWKIPERIATKYWEITLSDGTILNLVGSNGKSHRLYNVTKQRFDYPQDFDADDITHREDGTTARVVSCKQIEKTVKFYNIASHEHINVYANGVLTSNRLNNRFKIVDNKFTDEKAMSDKEVADYIDYLERIKAK